MFQVCGACSAITKFSRFNRRVERAQHLCFIKDAFYSTSNSQNITKQQGSKNNSVANFYNSTKAAELIAKFIEDKPFTITKIPNAGRGLVATKTIAQGSVLFQELPLLAHPNFERECEVCYHCLKTLDGPGRVYSGGSSHVFCSRACLEAATKSYFVLEEALAPFLDSSKDKKNSRSRKFLQNTVSKANETQATATSSEDSLGFTETCRKNNERFPLLAKRLALMHCVEAIKEVLSEYVLNEGHQETHNSNSDRSSHNSFNSSSALSSTSASIPSSSLLLSMPLEGLATRDLGLLCFANVALPLPEPWVTTHALLRDAVTAAADASALDEACISIATEMGMIQENSPSSNNVTNNISTGNHRPLSPRSSSSPPLSPTDPTVTATARVMAAARLLPSLFNQSPLTAEWFASVLARLHLNVFRVDAIFQPDWGSEDLQRTLSSLVLGKAGAGSSGSAVYLLTSFLNHSCDPNVEVRFEENNSTATVAVLRDVEEGEQLCISYVDFEAPGQQRRDQLEWGYGFKCKCSKCMSELAITKEESQ